MLHQLTDAGREEARSDLGRLEPRRLPLSAPSDDRQALAERTDDLRRAVVTERTRLSTALVTWWTLLSSVPDTEEIIRHTADVALLFDGVRDASWDLDDAVRDGSDEEVGASEAVLRARVMACNASIGGIVEEISARLAADEVELSEKAQQALDVMHRRVTRER